MSGKNRTATGDDEAQIRRMVMDQEIGMRTRDAERLVSRYAPQIVKFDLDPPLQHLGSEVLDPARLNNWFSGFDGPVDYEIRDLTVTIGGDVAFCYSLNRMSATPRGSSESFDLWFRATVCLRKADGKWQIVHEHNSTPFYMDGTFGAALDLKP